MLLGHTCYHALAVSPPIASIEIEGDGILCLNTAFRPDPEGAKPLEMPDACVKRAVGRDA